MNSPETNQRLTSLENLRQRIKKPQPEYDVVVALGKNWRRNLTGNVSEQVIEKIYRDEKGNVLHDWNNRPIIKYKSRIYLSLESKMIALAAGELYAQGKAGKIIFSTGETAGKDPLGNPYPTEANEMKKFMRIYYPEHIIPEKAIIVENKSFDTAGNAEEVGKILKEKHIESVALLSVGFHLFRAKRLFSNYGVGVDHTFGSEGVLMERYPRYKRFIRGHNLIHGYHRSKQYFVEAGKEIIAAGLVYTVDPKGEKLRQKTLKTRHRRE
jgi:uncharacterized SAM-binding protein YcdF (DUF218 family)